MNRFRIKDRFSSTVCLTEAVVSEFANAVGDTNPLHHNPEFSRSRGFSDLVASGPQTSAMLMGMVANHFKEYGPMVGLEFQFFFKHAVLANTPLELEWMIIRIIDKPHHQAQLVELRGRLRLNGERTAVGAKGTVLVYRDADAGDSDNRNFD